MTMTNEKTPAQLKKIARSLRYFALRMSTRAGSGHPTSALSAADLMATLFVTTFRFDFNNPENPANDRLIFSKGHATPLYYPLFALAEAIKVGELDHYREFTSPLEGHPTPRFRYTEAATGSLGQGLSIGVGMAIALRAQVQSSKFKVQNYKRTNNLQLTTYNLPRVFVLLGDGEMAEGSAWEAMEVASKYKLNNLIGILDVNRLGQSDETMLGHDVDTYEKRIKSFGWETKVIDGHNFREILEAFDDIGRVSKPYMIIARTIKGKGVSFLEDKNGWHGKALTESDFQRAVKELGHIDLSVKIDVQHPPKPKFKVQSEKLKVAVKSLKVSYKKGDQIATRKAYGEALAATGEKYPQIVVLDGDVKNSTFSEIFKAKFPERFFEMYIAEQNMAGVAVGLARRGFIPFASTFAAFLTRAYDQIRMAAISRANIKFCGSHAGVSIGEDGPSQMGLEDLAMFRAIQGSTVLYPSDAISTWRLVEEMVKQKGIVYMRTTRPPTAVLYPPDEEFPVGGSKVHRSKTSPIPSLVRRGEGVVIIAAGVTLHEALKAQQELAKDRINTVVIDCYSIKPIDEKTIKKYGDEAGLVITVEDHWYDGGLGDAVLNVFAKDSQKPKIIKLAVTEMPRSGKPAELLSWAGIDSSSIIKAVKSLIKS